MNDYAKILSLSSTSAEATITSALKTYFRSVRLIKDAGSTIVNPLQPSYLTNVLLGNCIDSENRCLYVFFIDTLLHTDPITGNEYNSSWIIEINIDSRAPEVVYYDKYNAIGFDPRFKIYNARVVHGRLVWTDNKNPIYQMDIARAKKSFYYKIGYGQYPITVEWGVTVTYGIDQIVSNGNSFYKSLIHNNVGTEPKMGDETIWLKLCLIEDAYYSMDIKNFYFEPVPPKHPPEVTYQADDTRKINNLRQTLFQVAYRYIYMDWRKSTFSPASIVPVPQAEEETATGLANEQISLNNKLQIIVNSGGEEVRAVEIIGRSSQDVSKWFLIETIYKFEEEERGNQISRVSSPAYIGLSLTVPAPEVTNDNIPMPPVALAVDVADTFATGFNMRWRASVFADYGYYYDEDVLGYYLDVATDIAFTTFVAGYNNKDVGNVGNLWIFGLVRNTTYYFRVRAYNTEGSSDSSNIITVVTLAHALLPPASISFSLVEQTTARLDWSASQIVGDPGSPGVDGYELDVSTVNTFATFVGVYHDLDILNVLTILLNHLTADTWYYCRLRAYNSVETSENSGTVSFKTLVDASFAAPVISAATNVLQTSFTANWNAVTGATGYYFDLATNIMFTPDSFVRYSNENVGNVLTFDIAGLTPNTTYYYRVRAYNTSGTSDSSANTAVTLLPVIPLPPSAVAVNVIDVSADGFRAKWTGSVGATGYYFDLSTSPVFATYVAGYNNKDVGDVRFLWITGLPRHFTYYYRLRAYNVSGTSANSNVITVTSLLNDLAAPYPITVGTVTKLTMHLYWQIGDGGATGYRLDVSTVNTFASFVAGYQNLDVGNVFDTWITHLTANTQYYCRLRAYNAVETSVSSGTVSFKTLT